MPRCASPGLSPSMVRGSRDHLSVRKQVISSTTSDRTGGGNVVAPWYLRLEGLPDRCHRQHLISHRTSVTGQRGGGEGASQSGRRGAGTTSSLGPQHHGGGDAAGGSAAGRRHELGQGDGGERHEDGGRHR